jgi:tetratricopeptide (TPR) repeat protein
VASALVFKGVLLGTLGRFEDAIKVYEEVTERFGDNNESGLMDLVAVAFLGKGVALQILGRGEQAEESFREGIRSDSELTEAYIALIRLLATKPEKQVDVLLIAEEIVGRRPGDAELLNTVSREFYKHGAPSLLQQGEIWARHAVSISPKNLYMKHTLACILSALGEGSEALALAREYVADADVVEKSIEDAIELFVGLASSGYANEALELLMNSPSAKHVEPLVVGLKLYIGEDVKTAVEILEVAKDVVKRIEDRKKRHEKDVSGKS